MQIGLKLYESDDINNYINEGKVIMDKKGCNN